MSEREIAVRLEAAAVHLRHGVAGDVEFAEAIDNARRLIDAAERLLGQRGPA